MDVKFDGNLSENRFACANFDLLIFIVKKEDEDLHANHIHSEGFMPSSLFISQFKFLHEKINKKHKESFLFVDPSHLPCFFTRGENLCAEKKEVEAEGGERVRKITF